MQVVSRNILLDIFKVIAATMIVAVHCGFLFEHNKFAYHITSNGLFRIAVPFFFCINGFFLYTIFQKQQLQIWVQRIAILYMVWMLIFAYFWLVPNYTNPFKILTTICFGFNHLWYLAALLPAGILLYRIRKFSNINLCFTALCLYLIGFSIQTLGNLEVFAEGSLAEKLVNFPPVYRNFLCFALPFLCIGYVIRRMQLHEKTTKKQAVLYILFSEMLLIAESVFNYYFFPDGTFNSGIFFIAFAATLLVTAFAFSYTTAMNGKTVSAFSVAIYLVHPLIIFLILRFFELESTPLTFVTIPITWIVSYILVVLNKKLKYIL